LSTHVYRVYFASREAPFRQLKIKRSVADLRKVTGNWDRPFWLGKTLEVRWRGRKEGKHRADNEKKEGGGRRKESKKGK